MKTITFGVKDTNGYHYKLIICNETKEYEKGKICTNSKFIDVWLDSKKKIEIIEDYLKSCGYTKTDAEFGKVKNFKEYKEWCISNNLKPGLATTLERFMKA